LTEYAQLLHGFWDIGRMCLASAAWKMPLLPGAGCLYLPALHVPDNIYRYIAGTDEPLIKENEDQFKPLEPGEGYLVPW